MIAIADYLQSRTIPIQGASLKMVRKSLEQAPDNWKGVIIVTDNHVIRAMVNIFQKANRNFGHKIYVDSTLDAAVKRAQNLHSQFL